MQYQLVLLDNGYVSVFDRLSGLHGLWHTDGTPRHGDLTYGQSRDKVSRLVRERFAS